MRGNESPYRTWIKFCRVVGIPDVVTCANFSDDRLGGLGVAGGQFLRFPIGFRCRAYNTLTLLSDSVITAHEVTNVTDRQKDRQRDRQEYYVNNSLCTKVHCAVKGLFSSSQGRVQGRLHGRMFMVVYRPRTRVHDRVRSVYARQQLSN